MDYLPFKEAWLHAQPNLTHPPEGVSAPWWPTTNRFLAGFRPNELTLLCAPTGAGKTQWLANLSAQVLFQGVAHFAAPVETGQSDYAIRVVSAMDRRDYNNGEPVSPEDLQALHGRYGKLIENGPMYLSTHDGRVEVSELINTIKYMYQQYGCRMAILDNLNFFMKVTRSADQLIEMDETIRKFVMLAKDLPVHTILVVHPKKTDGGRVESEFDLKGSSTAVQEAANVILFNRPTKEDLQNGKRLLTDRELVFRKLRKRGPFIGKPIWFHFENGRYSEIYK